MSDEVLIKARELSLAYKTKGTLWATEYFSALKNVDFDVKKGETLGVIGPNGAGKSTLLRVLAGIYQPDSGRLEKKVSSIALMTLDLGFDPLLSGRANAIFGGMLLGFSRTDVESRLQQIQDYSGLGDSFWSPVKTYSTGMASRLSFAIAINMSPEVMLLDEVLSVGDEEFKERAYSTLAAKIRSEQTTVLVSHSVSEIQKLCDRVLLLDAGASIMIGEPDVVIEKYLKKIGRTN